MKRTKVGISLVGVAIFFFLVMSGCNADKTAQSDVSVEPSGSGSITDWPESVREAISTSPDLVVQDFGATDLETLERLVQRISELTPRTQSETERFRAYVDSTESLLREIVSDVAIPGTYLLGTGPICEMVAEFTPVLKLQTSLAETYAKQHAFEFGNQFSWPAFIQAVWADVSTDRALLAVENGSTIADADNAISELDLVVWHSNNAVTFEAKSYEITGDSMAQSVIKLLKAASELGQSMQQLVGICKESL